MGSGFGGFLALRTTQLHPESFRCAVAIDAPLDLEVLTQENAYGSASPAQKMRRAFFERHGGRIAEMSVLRAPEQLTKPVMLILEPALDDVVTAQNDRLRRQLSRQGRAAEYLEVKRDFALGLPAARTKAYRQIEEFFNLHLYDYNVKLGPTKEIP